MSVGMAARRDIGPVSVGANPGSKVKAQELAHSLEEANPRGKAQGNQEQRCELIGGRGR